MSDGWLRILAYSSLAYRGPMVTVSVPDTYWAERIDGMAGIEIVVDDLRSRGPRAEDIEVAVPPYLGGWDTGLMAGMPSLELVQLFTAGYETVAPHVPDGVVLANAAGVHEASTSELAVALALAALRGIPRFVRAQEEGDWLPQAMYPALADRRVLILGYGAIGRAVAARMAPFEVHLTAVASRARGGDGHVGHVHGIDELPDLLPQQDVVVVIVPLSPSTERLVDDAFLSRMPDGSVLVNVARGRVADTDALLRHAGRITLALDVTDPEPLPADHPLWHAPGVLISPHTGGSTSAFFPRAERLLRTQLERYLAGSDLVNVVN